MTKSVSEAELQVAAKHVILQQTQGRKSILSHSLLRSDSGNTLSDSYLQTQLEIIEVDLDHLGEKLTEKAKSLGVKFKLPRNSTFAQWNKKCENSNDEGYTEALEYICTFAEASFLPASTKELSAVAARNTKGENELELDAISCRIRCASAEKESLLGLLTATTSESKTPSGGSMGESMYSPANVPKSTENTLTDNVVPTLFCSGEKSNPEASIRDAADTPPKSTREQELATLPAVGVHSSVLSLLLTESYSSGENMSRMIIEAEKYEAR
nr:uncharacterized protein LOC112277685 [Physcomitrium patens]XP_024366066.1 uncharacterized protein LOC112277685 [Physcomitrium patens]|eukprot:XP_024366065.1 uncharacterized protein LOC112277685 [Physcomitrella patens]